MKPFYFIDVFAHFMAWWTTPDQRFPVPCPACGSPDKENAGCHWYIKHPNYSQTGADPPCVEDIGYG